MPTGADDTAFDRADRCRGQLHHRAGRGAAPSTSGSAGADPISAAITADTTSWALSDSSLAAAAARAGLTLTTGSAQTGAALGATENTNTGNLSTVTSAIPL